VIAQSFYEQDSDVFWKNLQVVASQTNIPLEVYRIQQIKGWAYSQRIASWNLAVNLPKTLRQLMIERYFLRSAECVLSEKSSDSTEKFLLKLRDGALIESVVICDGERRTLCVSSQVGCAYGCRFCASGLRGYERNLSTDEILSQVLVVEDVLARRGLTKQSDHLLLDNIVYMGMGEPLANRENVEASIKILNERFHFGARRITVSTSGVVDAMDALATNPLQFRLAVSLHATRNDVRDAIMPVNKKYPLEKLLQAIERFSQTHHGMVTLEYILIKGLNDSLTDARELSAIAKKLHAHVNLIPYNPIAEFAWKRPSVRECTAFFDVLQNCGISSTLRREKGCGINAACGQLRLKSTNVGTSEK
jgi:23S rRNA (adenine2503-C2)-methyltransferase